MATTYQFYSEKIIILCLSLIGRTLYNHISSIINFLLCRLLNIEDFCSNRNCQVSGFSCEAEIPYPHRKKVIFYDYFGAGQIAK